MARMGFKRNFSPLKILTEEQLDDIHRSTLRVLEETGLRIEHEKALKLLDENGCKVDFDSRRVKFPPLLVEDCLRKCPRSFRVRARNPKNDIILGGNTVYFGAAPGMHTVDLDTWKPRPATRKEFYDAVTITDALDNPQITSNYYPYFGFEGVPPVMCIPEGFAARLRNQSKPICTAYSNNCEIFTIEMAKAVGTEAWVGPLSSPPLTWYEEAIEALYRGLEADFPIRVIDGNLAGSTSPATTAGTIVVSNATQIAVIVLAQLVKPGARMAVLPLNYAQNMKSGLITFASIQESLLRASVNQYWRRIGIPIMNICSYSNSKLPDVQYGYEKGIMFIISALTGPNVVYHGGALYGELTYHPINLILDDDVANMVGRFLQGFEVNDETLAVDLINQVGPSPGIYLDKEHTRKWWKTEQFVPKAVDSLGIPEWMEQGKKKALDYAKERMEEILATHKPDPLTPKQEEDVVRILQEAYQYYRERGML